MRRFIGFVLLIGIFVVTSFFIEKTVPRIETTTDIRFFQSNNYECQYEIEQTNKMKCNLDTANFIVNAMIDDGFSIIDQESNEEFVSISIQKEDVGTFNIRWLENGEFTSIGSPYIKSYLPLTYLNK